MEGRNKALYEKKLIEDTLSKHKDVLEQMKNNYLQKKEQHEQNKCSLTDCPLLKEFPLGTNNISRCINHVYLKCPSMFDLAEDIMTLRVQIEKLQKKHTSLVQKIENFDQMIDELQQIFATRNLSMSGTPETLYEHVERMWNQEHSSPLRKVKGYITDFISLAADIKAIENIASYEEFEKVFSKRFLEQGSVIDLNQLMDYVYYF